MPSMYFIGWPSWYGVSKFPENGNLLDSETQSLAAVKESRQKKRNKKREEENVEGDFHICV